MTTWSFHESHYYSDDPAGKSWCEPEAVFIPTGGSIAKFVLDKSKQLVEDGIVYCQQERGMSGYGVSGELKELILLLPDGRKITGFKPKSIAHLFTGIPCEEQP